MVTDGDLFESAWGARPRSGSLMRWGWQQAVETVAYYNEAKWLGPSEDGEVERIRRKAIRVWPKAV